MVEMIIIRIEWLPNPHLPSPPWYVRDATGNVMSVYSRGDNSQNSGQLTQSETHLYGSSRIGLFKPDNNVESPPIKSYILLSGVGSAYFQSFERGRKIYELSNHLGNVLATVSDRRIALDADQNEIVDYYSADVLTAQDYYPFGMMMQGRSFSSGGYRYGFNGKENDNEVKGAGNQQDYGMRFYDPRVGRFLSVDPLTKSFPMLSSYQFASNSPIANIDLDGSESKYYSIELLKTINGRGTLIQSTSKLTEEKSKEAGWFVSGAFYRSPGRFGEGSLYTITASKTILKDNGSEEIIIQNIGAIYVPPPPKPSPNRPVSSMPLNVVVFGGGYDSDQAPGSRPNPNAKTVSFNFAQFQEMLEPILLGYPEKIPGQINIPTVSDFIEWAGTEGLEKALEKVKEVWNENNKSNSDVKRSVIIREIPSGHGKWEYYDHKSGQSMYIAGEKDSIVLGQNGDPDTNYQRTYSMPPPPKKDIPKD